MKDVSNVSFIGEISGDGECFLWNNIPIVQRAGLCEGHAYDLEHGFPLDCLYPGDIFNHLRCDYNKKYRFTTSVEEIK